MGRNMVGFAVAKKLSRTMEGEEEKEEWEEKEDGQNMGDKDLEEVDWNKDIMEERQPLDEEQEEIEIVDKNDSEKEMQKKQAKLEKIKQVKKLVEGLNDMRMEERSIRTRQLIRELLDTLQK